MRQPRLRITYCPVYVDGGTRLEPWQGASGRGATPREEVLVAPGRKWNGRPAPSLVYIAVGGCTIQVWPILFFLFTLIEATKRASLQKIMNKKRGKLASSGIIMNSGLQAWARARGAERFFQ